MDDLRISEELTIPAAELEWTFLPSGGPGGQHANRSSTKVVLCFDVAASAILDEATRGRLLERLDEEPVSVTVGDSRSQWRNRQLAKQRLRDRINAALAPDPPARKKTRPGRRARQRRLSLKRKRSQTKALRKRPELED